MTASHASYELARKLWNGMVDQRPALIVQCIGTADVVASVRELLASPSTVSEMVEVNYQVGLQHMSHQVMRERLLPLLEGAG